MLMIPDLQTIISMPEHKSELEQAVLSSAKVHKGMSGFRLISHGDKALTMRLGLIEAAERSLDIQYYSMQNDLSGKILIEYILRAADRGVKVRILLDDLNHKTSDEIWLLLDSHPNVTLKIFNPLAAREQGVFGRIRYFFTNIWRYTKRMHNKVLVADRQVSVVGGRNLGDSYFQSSKEFNFHDIDVLSAGPVSGEIAESFDTFWNYPQAVPLRALNPARFDAKRRERLREKLVVVMQSAEGKAIISEIPSITMQLRFDLPPMVWANAELAADSPTKIYQSTEQAVSKPASKLRELTAQAKHEFIGVSSYFVPGAEGVEWLKEMTARGVKVSILTNSLASIDVIAAFSGYQRYREKLVASGINLYELKSIFKGRRRISRFIKTSRASLHTKIYVVDREYVIIGTMNLDPRSVQLNTEIALVIHSTQLAEELVSLFENAVAPGGFSYQIVQAGSPPHTHLEWRAKENGRNIRYLGDPGAGLWRSIKAGIFASFPFEEQL